MTGLDLAGIAISCLLASAVTPDAGADGPTVAADGAHRRRDGTEPATERPAQAPTETRMRPSSGPALDNLRDSVEIDVESPESFDSLSLEEILNMQVVTATGEEEDRALAPANVLVVTREDIAFHGYHSMAELLAGVPGLFVTDDLVNPSVAVNGVSGGLRGGTRIMRTMINGVEVNFRPDLTAFLGPEYIPMDAIERVEIAKGPLSALYGANAFLATVNVITRVPPTGTSSMAGGWLSRLQGNGGFGASGSVGFNDGHKSFFASFVLDQLDRSGMGIERTFPAQQYTPQLFAGRSRNDVRQSVGTFVSFRATGDRLGALAIQGGLQSFDAGTEFQINSLFSHASRLALANAWSSALWERSWSRLVQTAVSTRMVARRADAQHAAVPARLPRRDVQAELLVRRADREGWRWGWRPAARCRLRQASTPSKIASASSTTPRCSTSRSARTSPATRSKSASLPTSRTR